MDKRLRQTGATWTPPPWSPPTARRHVAGGAKQQQQQLYYDKKRSYSSLEVLTNVIACANPSVQTTLHHLMLVQVTESTNPDPSSSILMRANLLVEKRMTDVITRNMNGEACKALRWMCERDIPSAERAVPPPPPQPARRQGATGELGARLLHSWRDSVLSAAATEQLSSVLQHMYALNINVCSNTPGIRSEELRNLVDELLQKLRRFRREEKVKKKPVQDEELAQELRLLESNLVDRLLAADVPPSSPIGLADDDDDSEFAPGLLAAAQGNVPWSSEWLRRLHAVAEGAHSGCRRLVRRLWRELTEFRFRATDFDANGRPWDVDEKEVERTRVLLNHLLLLMVHGGEAAAAAAERAEEIDALAQTLSFVSDGGPVRVRSECNHNEWLKLVLTSLIDAGGDGGKWSKALQQLDTYWVCHEVYGREAIGGGRVNPTRLNEARRICAKRVERYMQRRQQRQSVEEYVLS